MIHDVFEIWNNNEREKKIHLNHYLSLLDATPVTIFLTKVWKNLRSAFDSKRLFSSFYLLTLKSLHT